MTRKKFETIDELKESPHYVPPHTFKEIITIGSIDFLMYYYSVVDDDDSYVAFGCFHKFANSSPVFDTFSNAMRYAIDTYNERKKNDNI